MRIQLPTVLLLAALLMSLVSCGSVAGRSVPGSSGGSTGSDGGGVGGAMGPDGGGSGGSAGGGAGGGGGIAGTGGTGGGSAAGGAGGGGSVDAGVFVRGSLGPFGPTVSAGAIRIMRQRLGPGLVCAGNVCATGGLVP